MKRILAIFLVSIASAVIVASCSNSTSSDSVATNSTSPHDIDFRKDTLPAAKLQRGKLSSGYEIQKSRTTARAEKLFPKGKNIREVLGSGEFGKDEIIAAVREMLLANSEVIAVSTGRFVSDGLLHDTDTSTHLVWNHMGTTSDGKELEVSGSQIRVQFSSIHGEVQQITNTAADNVDGLAPATLTIDDAKKSVLSTLNFVSMNLNRNGVTKSELVDFSPTSAELKGPMIYVKKDGAPIVAYFAEVKGLLTGLGNGDKKDIREVWINARDAKIEADFPTTAGAFDAQGFATVYQYPNYPATYRSRIYHLDENQFTTIGRFVSANNEADGNPIEPSRDFNYTIYPPSNPLSLQTAPVEAYFAGDGFITFLRQLGFESLFNGPALYIDALDGDFFISAYSAAVQQLWLNAGASIANAFDQTLVAHEEVHWAQHRTGILIGLNTPYQVPYANQSFDGNTAMAESFADFIGTGARYQTPNFGAILAADLQGGNPSYYRYLKQDLTLDDNWNSSNYYDQSLIWSSALWKLAETIGFSMVARIGQKSVECINDTDGFNEGLKCFEQADIILNSGRNLEIIRAAFAFAKIPGLDDLGNVRLPYDFPAEWLESDHPYADNENSNLILRIRNARTFGGIQFTFGPWDDVGKNDHLNVIDDRGNTVATFTKGTFANRRVNVRNTDYVVFNIVSVPGDNERGNGFNIAEATVINSVMGPPQFIATASVTSGKAPLPVTFKVTGNNLSAVTVDTGNGVIGHLTPNTNGEWMFEQTYDLLPDSSPISTTQTFNAVITVNKKNEIDTRTIPIEVKPYRPRFGPHFAPYSFAAGGSGTGTPPSGGTIHCTRTPTGFVCI